VNRATTTPGAGYKEPPQITSDPPPSLASRGPVRMVRELPIETPPAGPSSKVRSLLMRATCVDPLPLLPRLSFHSATKSVPSKASSMSLTESACPLETGNGVVSSGWPVASKRAATSNAPAWAHTARIVLPSVARLTGPCGAPGKGSTYVPGAPVELTGTIQRFVWRAVPPGGYAVLR